MLKKGKVAAFQKLAESVERTPGLQEFDQQNYQGEIEGESYRLTTHAAGHAAHQRPMGFGNGGKVPLDQEAKVGALEHHLGIRPNKKPTPRQKDRREVGTGIMDAISGNEGKADSVNTWDNAILTFGAGMTSAGVLQKAMWQLRTEYPVDFQKVFGRYGIDIHKEKGTNAQFSVVDPEQGTRLRGKTAEHFIANSPKLLIAFRHAGRNLKWQEAQARVTVGYSVMAGLDFTFTVKLPAEGSVPARKVTLVLADVLKDAGGIRGAALAAVADRKHAFGHVGRFKSQVPKLFLEVWLAQAKEERFKDGIPSLKKMEAKEKLAVAVFKLAKKVRRKKIAEHYPGVTP